jgi:uncharacterized phiE125 gp8 family phage protein
MNIRQVTLPTAEPISVAQAKAHIKALTNDEDALVTRWIKTAREQAEALLNRAIVARSWEKQLDAFPVSIELPWAPVRSVVSLKYLDVDGVEQTLAPASYTLDKHATPGWLVPAYGLGWPSTRSDINAVRVRYVAGMAQPFTADAATDVLTAVGHGYANGEEVPVFTAGGAVPTGLADGGQYFATSVATDTLKLAATAGGAAIDITANGTPPNFLGHIPEGIVAAMLLMLGHWELHREEVAERQLYEIPLGAQSLLRPNSLLVI